MVISEYFRWRGLYSNLLPAVSNFCFFFPTDCGICAVYTAREESTIRNEAVKLISDGLERQQSSLLESLFSSSFPQQMVCVQSASPS